MTVHAPQPHPKGAALQGTERKRILPSCKPLPCFLSIYASICPSVHVHVSVQAAGASEFKEVWEETLKAAMGPGYYKASAAACRSSHPSACAHCPAAVYLPSSGGVCGGGGEGDTAIAIAIHELRR